MGEMPSQHQRHERNEHSEQSCPPAADAVGHRGEHGAKQRSAQQGHGGEQSFLRRVEVQLLGDKWSQRPEQDPDHEADVKVEKRGN